MKPKHLCTKCEAEIQWGSEKCPRCGLSVEWPSENRKKQQGDVEKKAKAFSFSSSTSVIGIAILVIVAVVVIDKLTSPKQEAPAQMPMGEQQAQGANIEALRQIEQLEAMVKANPGDDKTMLQLANLLHDNKFFDKSIMYYVRYLEKNPKNPDARVDLGIVNFEMGRLDEAQKQMELALKYSPKHQPGHYNLGIVNLQAGRMKEANEWFKKAIALDPNSQMGQQAKQIMEQHSNSPKLQTK